MSDLVTSQRNVPVVPIHINSAFPPAPGFSPIPSFVRIVTDTCLETTRQFKTAKRQNDAFDITQKAALVAFELSQKKAMADAVGGMLRSSKRDVEEGFQDPDVANWFKDECMKTLKKS